MIKSVCIVGCGWFGLPLAKALVAGGVKVFGSKRLQTEVLSLQKLGINGFRLDLDDDAMLAQERTDIARALSADCLVINIPPGLRKDPDAYLLRLAKLKQLIDAKNYKKVIFVSTTGVYPQVDKVLSEQDACAHSEISTKLLQAEALFSELDNSVTVRFAGLVGPQRHPGRFLAGKTGLLDASAAVNLVHLNDCILAVSTLLFNQTSRGVYNVCAPLHPTRQAFYSQAARELGLVEPQFSESEQVTEPSAEDTRVTGKQICSERLCSELNFEYQFSNPIDMLLAC
ncbi:SDR family NAD(P)-dependent oxidoreductase [Shewanella schlegeliana]|uniref:SDR family NAD(P)-dependent oxidoreductase n=1 Tax=Shewanella schlegeliana TaxID=190308 RepID=A0ABS1SXE8_9GAMM|nr:SDR family NAD(P)-dependent oxidoreductase [Shewanella schlegeliana]MBL4913074.1 SDR family NAD(P)-dependent oxidoreductase [Shewanella schlegeliana]MCL1111088.1 SDR family NAD(P)-dependent oxidoreductase [Shewanella schlegeliana]GIU28359.1 NAD(P)-dependent oxidoreductase [Shewanella schlegeliana]